MKPGKRMLGPCSLRLGYTQIAPAHLRGGLLEISKLHTPEEERKQGHATRLLAQVCAEADKACKVLVLMADSVPLSTFYSRFGFKVMQEHPIVMVRSPLL